MPTESGASFIAHYQTKLIEGKLDAFVTVILSSTVDGAVSLDTIKSHHLGRGYAKCALATLLLLADEYEYEIRLVPHPLDEMTNRDRLVRWYEAYGFVHLGTNDVMVRPAKKRGNLHS
jgi:hypothetical protein